MEEQLIDKQPGDPQQVAAEIAERLGEPNVELLARVVEFIGEEQARAILQQTLEVEAGEGLMVHSGKRRRTPGGVFFHLVKESLTKRKRKKLFPFSERHKATQAEQGEVQLTPREAWVMRGEALAEILASKEIGRATTMKVTLIGRPGKITKPGPFVVTIMRGPEKAPSLPKGLPMPSPSKVAYAVYISERQWKKVAESIKNPEDVLIVEGHLTYDEQEKKMSVFAQSVTTKLLEQAKREAQRGVG